LGGCAGQTDCADRIVGGVANRNSYATETYLTLFVFKCIAKFT
jgi:hypothetical protein